MNKIKAFTALAAAFAITCGSVGAATIDKLDVVQNNKNGKAEITVTVFGTSDDEYVSLSVKKPSQGESVTVDSFSMLKNVKVTDGKYTYTYTETDPAAGEYIVDVDGAPEQIKIMSYDDIAQFLENVNGAVDENEIVGYFEALKKELAIDSITGYDYDKTTLGAALLAEKPFSDAKSAVSAFKLNAVSLILSNGKNVNDAVKLAELYESDLGLESIDSYEAYKKMKAQDKTKVFTNMKNADVNNTVSFKKAFGEQIVLTAVGETESYGQVKDLLDEYDDIIDIDWSKKLKSIKQTSEIYKGLVGKYYQSTAKLEEAVDSLVKQQKKKEDKGSGGGNGGSGSVGVSGAASSSRPAGSTVTPAEPTVIFTDLGNSAWAKNAIVSLAEKKILSGMADGIFAPEAQVTREQFVTAVVKVFGLSGGEDPNFVDVKPGEWYYESVCIAYKNGIVSGIDETHFGVGKTLTREEMATLCYRAMQKAGYVFVDNSANFGDSDAISTWAASAVDAMFNEGIISGFPNGNFEPRGNCTRAQMAVVLDKVFNLI